MVSIIRALERSEPSYLRPTAPIAPDALLVADPGLAMALAQAVLVKPLMSNHHHGLWGYSGATPAGRALTVQSTGIGGPSTAAVVAELAGHGVARAIRLGTCTALAEHPAAGDVVVAGARSASTGPAPRSGSSGRSADPDLTAALSAALGEPASVTVAGYDLPVASAPAALRASWVAAGASAADGETAALLAAAGRERVAVGVGLIVTASEAADLVELGERAVRAFDQLG